MPETVFEPRGVAFQSDALLHQNAENFVQDISVFFIGIIQVAVGAVANHIVNVTAYIETGEDF